MDEFIIARQKVEIWSFCVLKQVERINQECINIENEDKEDDKWKYNMSRIGDDHFLKISIKNAIDWLGILNVYIEETNEIYTELSNKKDILDLRNMAEHEIDYYNMYLLKNILTYLKHLKHLIILLHTKFIVCYNIYK